MSDKFRRIFVDPFVNKGRKFLLFALITVAVLVVILPIACWHPLNFDAIVRGLRYGEKPMSLNLDANASAQYCVLGKSLLTVSSGGASLRKLSDGKEVSASSFSENPTVRRAGNFAVSFDSGGLNLCYIRENRNSIEPMVLPGELYDADVSPSGFFCTATSENGYKTVLRLYDTEKEEVFRWFSASRFLPLCAVSANGCELAAISYSSEQGEFFAELLFFRADRNEIHKVVRLPDSLVLGLRYVNDRTLCVLTQDEVMMFQTNGDLRGTYDYSGELMDFSLTSDEFVLLSLPSYETSGGAKLTAVDMGGKEIGSYITSSPCHSVSSSGYYAAALTDDQIVILTKKMRLYGAMPAKNISQADICSDGSAIVINEHKAERLLP